MKRIIMMLTVAFVLAAMMSAMAMPAFAEQGGTPNAKACHGQVVSIAIRTGEGTPREVTDLLGFEKVSRFHHEAKIGDLWIFPRAGGIISCSFPLPSQAEIRDRLIPASRS